MKVLFRKSIAIWIVLLALALAACGGAEEPAAEPAAQPTTLSEVAPTEETMAEPSPMATEMMDEMAPTEEAMAEPTEEMMDEPTAEATEESMADHDMAAMDPLMLDGTAAGLRVALNRLLGEHVLLAAGPTNAALDGRNDDFEAAAAALDENCLLYTSPSPRDRTRYRMPSSA